MPLYLSVAILQCQFLAMYVQFPLFQTVSVASESAEVRGCRPRPLRRPQEGRPPHPLVAIGALERFRSIQRDPRAHRGAPAVHRGWPLWVGPRGTLGV